MQNKRTPHMQNHCTLRKVSQGLSIQDSTLKSSRIFGLKPVIFIMNVRIGSKYGKNRTRIELIKQRIAADFFNH
jgi:hypothetical protein